MSKKPEEYNPDWIQEILQVYQKRAKRLDKNQSDLGTGNANMKLGSSDNDTDFLYKDSRFDAENFNEKYFLAYLIDFRIFMNKWDTIKKKNEQRFFEEVLNIIKIKYPDNKDLDRIERKWKKLNEDHSLIKLNIPKSEFIDLRLNSIFHEDRNKNKKLEKRDYQSALETWLFIDYIREASDLIIAISKFIDKNYTQEQ
jgi:hypothetical protein